MGAWVSVIPINISISVIIGLLLNYFEYIWIYETLTIFILNCI